MRPDIAPGGTFPDYELPDHESVPRRLSELQGDDPMILSLARGLREAWEAGDHSPFHGWEPLVRRQGERRPGKLT